MSSEKPLPSLVTIQEHCWALAALVHPIQKGMTQEGWRWRIATEYGLEFATLDGAMTYEWAMILWAGLAARESQRVATLHARYDELQEQERLFLEQTKLQAR